MDAKEYHNLRYNEVRFKASHNSFERNEQPMSQQLGWDLSNPHQKGCRGLEWDLMQHKDYWRWRVKHDRPYENRWIIRFRFPPLKRNSGNEFSDELRKLKQWSDQNPEHDVITIHLDLKNAHQRHDEFPERIDNYILQYLDRGKIFTPRELIRGANDIVSGAMAHGWPKLDSLRGKFIFCFSGKDKDKAVGKRKEFYANDKPIERLCFVDKALSGGENTFRPATDRGNRIFFNFRLKTDNGKWRDTLRWFATQRGFITRGYGANSNKLWKLALANDVNIVSTDRVSNYPWARVGDQPFEEIQS